jgi:DNA invertase Pin-like site-specific DNA recombinase
LFIGYARASQQAPLDAQLEALAHFGCETMFSDLRVGSAVVRPALEAALDRAAVGDVIVVTRLEVLAHDHRDLMRSVMILRRRQLDLVVVETAIDTRNGDDLLISALALLARFEMEVREAREGETALPSAKPRARTISDEDWPDIQERIDEGELSVDEAAEELGVDPATVQRRLKRQG